MHPHLVVPFLSRLQPDKVTDFNLDCARLGKLVDLADRDLAVCFLGNSGVGKSTLYQRHGWRC